MHYSSSFLDNVIGPTLASTAQDHQESPPRGRGGHLTWSPSVSMSCGSSSGMPQTMHLTYLDPFPPLHPVMMPCLNQPDVFFNGFQSYTTPKAPPQIPLTNPLRAARLLHVEPTRLGATEIACVTNLFWT